LVMPGLALTYLIAGPPRLLVRFGQLLAGLGAMIVAAGWWVLLAEFWPADSRPYIGGSENNSFLDLTLGYNGLGRLMGGDSNTPGVGSRPDMAGGGASPFGEPGFARLFSGESGGQISWLLPAALIVLTVGLIALWRRARTDPHRAQYLAWGGWLIGTAGVFSFMSGLYHDYYTVALAPAIAALVGIGAVDLWQRRETTWAVIILAATTVMTGAWAWVLLGRTPDFVGWLRWAILAAAMLAATALVIAALPTVGRPQIRSVAAAAAIIMALAGPLSYSIQTLTVPHTGGVVTAGPQIPGKGIPGMSSAGSADSGRTAGPPGETDNEVSADVITTLSANSDSFTWAAAAPGSTEAGYYQLATGLPVMALGGFASSDPAPTLEQFQDYVADGRVHYYVESTGLGLPKGAGDSGKALTPPGADGSTEAERIEDWVKREFTPVTVGDVTLYDLTEPPAGS
ncbi:MAG: glycosyl transferase, partial [Mycobacterium sp.]